MKTLALLFTILMMSMNVSNAQSASSFYDLEVKGLLEGELKMSDFDGKYVMIVNVASKCGYTPQYEDLQMLSERFEEKLVIIGFPCNQFGKQEPGSASEIMEFCSSNYEVSFPMAEKVDVKGSDQHPIYAWITAQTLDGEEVSSPKWNFHKYLIDPNGVLIGSFKSGVNPMDEEITGLIE